MSRKHREDDLHTQYLNKLLDEMPLFDASDDFADRVMKSLFIEEAAATPRAEAGRPIWKKQLLNGLIASAATVLFIQSGLIDKLVTIDSGISRLSSYIAQLSHLLPS